MLSGGGAKGLSHIGVIEVMDSLGIRPDLIVGTSMGAIIGALYASGYSGKQIDSMAKSLPLSDIFHAFQPIAPRSLEFLQPLLYWEQGERGFNLQRSTASTSEANAITNNLALRGNLLARGDFDSLPIPFRAVATNLADRSLVVIGTGDLARALRASYAIPLFFPPEKIDGQTLGDGGLVANVPVGVARRLGAKRVIVSDATSGVADSVGLDAPLTLVSHLVNLVFHQPADSLGAGDVLVRGDLTDYADFEVSAHGLERLVGVGREAARKALVASGCSTAPIAERALPRHLDGFHVQGRSDGARSELRSLLGLAHSDTVRPKQLAERLRRLASSERFAAVWLNPHGAGDSVSFDVTVQRPPTRTGGLGLAYDQELGGRVWLGYSDHRLLGLPVEGSAIARIGTFRDELQLELRGNQLLDRRLLNPLLSVQLRHENIRRFDPDGNSLSTMSTREIDALAGYEHEYRDRWWFQAGATGTAWHDSTRSNATAAGLAASAYQVDRQGDHSRRSRRAVDVRVQQSDGGRHVAAVGRRAARDAAAAIRLGRSAAVAALVRGRRRRGFSRAAHWRAPRRPRSVRVDADFVPRARSTTRAAGARGGRDGGGRRPRSSTRMDRRCAFRRRCRHAGGPDPRGIRLQQPAPRHRFHPCRALVLVAASGEYAGHVNILLKA